MGVRLGSLVRCSIMTGPVSTGDVEYGDDGKITVTVTENARRKGFIFVPLRSGRLRRVPISTKRQTPWTWVMWEDQDDN